MHIHKLRPHSLRSNLVLEPGLGFQYVAEVSNTPSTSDVSIADDAEESLTASSASATPVPGSTTSSSQTASASPMNPTTSSAIYSTPSSTSPTPTTSQTPLIPSSISSTVYDSSSLLPSTSATPIPETSSSSTITSTTPTTSTTSSSSSSSSPSASDPGTSLPVAAATSIPASTQTPALSTHSVPFFLGIALAVILAVALGAAIIAFCLRCRRKGKKGFWKEADEWTPTTSAEQNSDKLHIWEPRGDRDAGEPRKDEEMAMGLNMPPYAGSLHESVSYPLPIGASPYSHPSSTPLPMSPYGQTNPPQASQSHLSSSSSFGMGSSSYTSRTALFPQAGCGTPRRDLGRPRFLSLSNGTGLGVPWRQEGEVMGKFMEVEKQSLPLPEPTWDTPQHLDIPETTGAGWTSSLRSNIMNALNGLAPPPHAFDPQDDHLTPVPVPRRSVRKKPVVGKGGGGGEWETWVGGELIGPDESKNMPIGNDVGTQKVAPKRMDSLEDYKGFDLAFQASSEDAREADMLAVPGYMEGDVGVERKASTVSTASAMSAYTAEENTIHNMLMGRRSRVDNQGM